MYLNSATFSIPWHDILSSSMSWSSMRYCTTVSLSSVILFCSRPVGNTPAASFRSCQMCCRLIALELFWTGEVARSWKMIVESKSSSFCPSTGCSLSPVRVEFLLKTDSGYPKDTGVTLCDWRVFATQERKKKRRGWRCSSLNSIWDYYGSFDEQGLFSVEFARFRNFFDFAQIWGILESDKLWEIQCWRVAYGKDESW